MSDYNDLVRLINTKLSTAIQKYPTGIYGIVGSVPVELTHEKESGYSIIRVSNTYPSEQAAIDALLSVGVTKFQLSDCSWYGGQKAG
jgi:hypothetical protein